MYINIVTAKKVATGEILTQSIESEIALNLLDIQARLISMGWIGLSVFNEELTD